MSHLPSPATVARRASRALAAAVAAVVLVGVLQPASPAAAATAPIPAGYFGVHHAGLHTDGPLGWPQAPVGSVRLWDNGVSWREIETAPGHFDWARVDALVGKARANGASVLLVLGQTPRFHSSRPSARGAYGRGASAMPMSMAAGTRRTWPPTGPARRPRWRR
jgi:hypothetical protein